MSHTPVTAPIRRVIEMPFLARPDEPADEMAVNLLGVETLLSEAAPHRSSCNSRRYRPTRALMSSAETAE